MSLHLLSKEGWNDACLLSITGFVVIIRKIVNLFQVKKNKYFLKYYINDCGSPGKVLPDAIIGCL